MGTLADAKTLGKQFSNAEVWHRVTYDFSVDGGEVEDNIAFTAADDFVILDFYAYVETAATSGGSAVMDLGIGAGGTELWSDKAVADLAIGTVHGMDTAAPLKLASAGTIQFGVETAALTAGKIHFYIKVRELY